MHIFLQGARGYSASKTASNSAPSSDSAVIAKRKSARTEAHSFSATSPIELCEIAFRCALLFSAAVEIALRVSLIPRRRDLRDPQVYFVRL